MSAASLNLLTVSDEGLTTIKHSLLVHQDSCLAAMKNDNGDFWVRMLAQVHAAMLAVGNMDGLIREPK